MIHNKGETMTTEKTNTMCRCPVRPYYTLGSMASGSNHESVLLNHWQAEHGAHPYAKVRDELARAVQTAEKDLSSGEAVLDMVHDIFGLPRYSTAPTAAGEVVREAARRVAKLAEEAHLGGEYTGVFTTMPDGTT